MVSHQCARSHLNAGKRQERGDDQGEGGDGIRKTENADTGINLNERKIIQKVRHERSGRGKELLPTFWVLSRGARFVRRIEKKGLGALESLNTTTGKRKKRPLLFWENVCFGSWF